MKKPTYTDKYLIKTEFVKLYMQEFGCTRRAAKKVYRTADRSYIDEMVFGKNREMSAYNFAFVNNSATIYFYKSKRKHARVIKAYHIKPLIPGLGDDMIYHKISSEHLKAHFLEIFRSLIHYSKRNDINISVSCNEWKNVVIHGEKKAQSWYWETERKHFNNFREASRWLYYNLFCRIYPYCEVDFAEVDFNDHYKEIDVSNMDKED